MTDQPMTARPDPSYPLAFTKASKMLSEAFQMAWDSDGRSQRQIAAKLGYRTSVPLSHMAIGRVPVPIERAPELARELGMDPAVFLLAVIDQRYPSIDVNSLLAPR